jgi:SecD/SecF fusion protein
MTPEGADEWGRMTSDNKDRIIAITMDSVVYSAPRVINAITTGNTQISGSFSFQEAEDLAGLLNGGALPAPCIIKEQTKVGPTIGAENTRAGLISFAVALIVVFIYMYLYYGKAGIVADIALFANIIFIFGTLASFGAVLTLAGIAGIVLTIGMAVDANVLVYERIREEQAKGKDIAAAIETGYEKALSSIIDANVTTLLTAIVLKIFGSGPIESFATTLIIGIFSSVFAALVISRLIFTWMLNKGYGISFGTKLTQNAFKNININFISKRNIYYVVSGLLVAGSIFAVLTIGLKPSVEFSGGRTFGVKFAKTADNNMEFIKEKLSSVMQGASIDVKTKSSNFYVEITTNYLVSDETATTKVKDKLEKGLDLCKSKLGSYKIEADSRFVSSSVSNELISSSTIAIVLSLIMIFAYILLRFGTWQYSLSAIIALFHDVMIVLGVFAVFNGILPFNMDVDQSFIAAILTVIGYSINDTVVVFDRIREELSWKKDADYKTEINGALNSTLSRTINTSLTTIIVLVVIFLFGGAAIQGFVFALLVGIVVGTYSSLLIATPMLIDLTKKLKN